jgi:hypothetical protein
LPVEAQTEQPEAFIAVRTSKHVSEDVLHIVGCMLRSQTKDVDAIEEREKICRDDLIDEHSGECNPKESNSFVIRGSVKVQPWCSDVNRSIRQ